MNYDFLDNMTLNGKHEYLKKKIGQVNMSIRELKMQLKHYQDNLESLKAENQEVLAEIKKDDLPF